MRYRVLALIAFLVATATVGPLSGAGLSDRTLSTEEVPVNLLANPGFEGDFSYHVDPYNADGPKCGELEAAEEWELWYENVQECPAYDPGCDPASYNRRPEYKREEGTSRVRSGDKAQKFFTTYGTHTAGLYQAVEVPADSWVRFSVWVWTWSSQKDIPQHSFLPGYYGVSVGIDPMGAREWDSPDIAWSRLIVRHDEWVHLQVDAYTVSETISAWTRGAQIWPVKHNDSYWDDARLIVLDGPPAPTATPMPTNTPAPTPDPTPQGYEPDTCWKWRTAWQDDFQGQLDGWGRDPAEGSIAVEGGALWLRNGGSAWEAFPLAWVERAWPESGDLRLSFHFAYDKPTGYGSTIGVGSEPYAGQRSLAGSDDPRGIEDILRIHHNMTTPGSGEYTVSLLGETVWTGTPGDSDWHSLQLELRESVYIVAVDGVERGRGVSYWRPRSLYLGNPVIVWDHGDWSEVAIDDLRLEVSDETFALPLIVRERVWPSPTPSATPVATIPAGRRARN